MNLDPQNSECPICHDTITDPVEMPCCKYRFCMTCLDGWKPNLDDCISGNRTCPCCRALIPPTLDTMYTIGYYKEVSLSLRILMQDPFVSVLPLPPFPNVEYMGPRSIRHFYENMETAYGQRVRIFERNYGSSNPNVIPSTPPQPVQLPDSVLAAVHANSYLELQKFLGPIPIPLQKLNAISEDNGNSLVHVAVHTNHYEMVKVLLALGAGPNIVNNNGLTPLHYAVRFGGNDNSIAKTLIRWGAKKASKILPDSAAAVDSDLVATAKALGNSELVRLLENEAIERHCKVKVNGVTKRGTILKECPFGRYQILLDDSKETVVVVQSNVEISKPLLFDFRDIDRAALFPNPSLIQEVVPPSRRGRFLPGLPPNLDHATFEAMSRSNRDEGQLVRRILGADPATMTNQDIRRPIQEDARPARRQRLLPGLPHNLDHATFEGMSTSRSNGDQRPLVRHILGVDTTTMAHQDIQRLLGRADETLRAMEYSRRMSQEVVRIHHEMDSERGFESSIHSRAFVHHMQESIAAADYDIQMLRDATAGLRERLQD